MRPIPVLPVLTDHAARYSLQINNLEPRNLFIMVDRYLAAQQATKHNYFHGWLNSRDTIIIIIGWWEPIKVDVSIYIMENLDCSFTNRAPLAEYNIKYFIIVSWFLARHNLVFVQQKQRNNIFHKKKCYLREYLSK